MALRGNCTDCGDWINFTDDDEAVDAGCGGCEGTMKFRGKIVKMNVRLCPKCYSPDRISQLIEQAVESAPNEGYQNGK